MDLSFRPRVQRSKFFDDFQGNLVLDCTGEIILFHLAQVGIGERSFEHSDELSVFIKDGLCSMKLVDKQ